MAINPALNPQLLSNQSLTHAKFTYYVEGNIEGGLSSDFSYPSELPP